ncbi:MAG: hypothetical protein J5903_02880, partial [Clostridia bacterium]|nr:hypothetical protein [Clostridia bacterium]
FSNMLAPAAFAINPEIKKNYEFLSSLSPIAVNMTGSGSAVFALFESKELCEWAAAKAKVAGINATVATTVGNYE